VIPLDCGDHVRDPIEACDDGCDATCMREDGWTCTLPGVACIATECGDGIRQPDLGEDCDAGPDNGASGSGCSETCTVIVQ